MFISFFPNQYPGVSNQCVPTVLQGVLHLRYSGALEASVLKQIGVTLLESGPPGLDTPAQPYTD